MSRNCRGASSVRSHDERRITDQHDSHDSHDSAEDSPGNGHVNDCLHERITRRGHQLGECGWTSRFARDLSLPTASNETKPWGREA